MRLYPDKLDAHLARGAAPISLVHGDEPFQLGEIGDRLRRHARESGFEEREVVVANAYAWASQFEPSADLGPMVVFLDPPYRRGLGERAIAAALAGGWLAEGALVVWEEAAPIAPPPALTLRDSRRYGDTMISLLRRTEA